MLKERFNDSWKILEFTWICMENHASVTGWQKLFTSHKCFRGSCNRYYWCIRLKILRLPNFNMLFQLVLTKFFISELFLCLPKVGHVIKWCKEPIPIVPIPPRAFVILFWKCCKCPTLGPGSSYNNPTVRFKTACKCLTSGPATPKFDFPVY